MPIALGLGAGAGSRRPLGYSIIGGMVLSTVLTLFLVPAVFVVFERLRKTKAAPVARSAGDYPSTPPVTASSEAR